MTGIRVLVRDSKCDGPLGTEPLKSGRVGRRRPATLRPISTRQRLAHRLIGTAFDTHRAN